MKTKLFFTYLLFSGLLFTQVNDTVVVGAGYSDQVFYRLSDGSKTVVSNTDWDLQFVTNLYSVAIRVNSGNGVILYEPSNSDTTNFTSTSVSLTGASQLRNGYDTWENSAFTSQATGHPDYGWGEYIGAGNLKGTKVFVLELSSGALKKIWIKSHSASGVYEIAVADTNGTNSQTITIDKTVYSSKTHVYYDIDNMSVLDIEPVSTDWDLVFRKYEDDLGGDTYYGVNGVLANHNIGIIEARGVNTTSAMSNWGTYTVDTIVNQIGYDWKDYQGSWVVESDLSYFVQDFSGVVYQIIFTDFESGAFGGIGKHHFTVQQAVNNTSLFENEFDNNFNVYPNPVDNELNIELFNHEDGIIKLMDVQGREIESKKVVTNQFTTHNINVNYLRSGLYFVSFRSEHSRLTERVIIK